MIIMLYHEIFETGNVFEKPEVLIVKRNEDPPSPRKRNTWPGSLRTGMARENTMNEIEEGIAGLLVNGIMVRAPMRDL